MPLRTFNNHPLLGGYGTPRQRPRCLSTHPPPSLPTRALPSPRPVPRRCENLKGHPGAVGSDGVGVGTLGGTEAGAFPSLLGDQVLRPGRSISPVGGAGGGLWLLDLPEWNLFRLPTPGLAVGTPVTSQEAGPAPLPGAGGAIGAGLARELR